MGWWMETVDRGNGVAEFEEMVVGWRDRGEGGGAHLGRIYQSAVVSLLLKIIYQHVSACDVMVQFDLSHIYWEIDQRHSRFCLEGAHTVDPESIETPSFFCTLYCVVDLNIG